MEQEFQKKQIYLQKYLAEKNWKKLGEILFLTIFCGIILAFLVFNFTRFIDAISEQLKQDHSLKETLVEVDATFQQKVVGREKFIDLYGVALTVLNQDIVGNFEFVRDDHDIIQRFSTRINTTPFLDSMDRLNDYAQEQDIPLVYVALPDKTKHLSLAESEKYFFDGQLSKQLGIVLEENEIDSIDIESLLSSDSVAPTFDEFFFKTDIHATTYGEFWMAQVLAQYLSGQYGMSFYDAEKVFDLDNYAVNSYEFIGNTARSAGSYFVGSDQFEIYKPNFETNLTLSNPTGQRSVTGAFADSVLNGYEENQDISKYTYWVTNYGQFMSPYYQYINHQADTDAPRLLIICDSLFMRGFSYLSLASKEITVVDPRYFDGTEYVALELAKNEYDGIVVVGSSIYFFMQGFQSPVVLSNLPQKDMITREEYGQWIGNQGMWLDECNGVKLSTQEAVQIDKTQQTVSLYGWAADFFADAPLSALYCKIGDMIVQCEYGIERESVVAHFQKENLRMTGFRINFPLQYITEAQVQEIQFILVSADGNYRYAPVNYAIG